MLTAEEQKHIRDGMFYQNFKDSPFWAALLETLQQYVDVEQNRLLNYEGRDADVIYRMFVEVDVRKRFMRFMASRIETEIGKIQEVADSHDVDLGQLHNWSLVDGE